MWKLLCDVKVCQASQIFVHLFTLWEILHIDGNMKLNNSENSFINDKF